MRVRDTAELPTHSERRDAKRWDGAAARVRNLPAACVCVTLCDSMAVRVRGSAVSDPHLLACRGVGRVVDVRVSSAAT
ncbi:MAG: hypothetical protein PVSMB4_20050 [Ktedonobacterales bacterium]